MQNKNQISLTRKFLYGVMVLGVLFSMRGSTMLSTARAQNIVNGLPEQNPTKNEITALAFPIFKLPWPSEENGNVKWTSGPHSWSKGGQLTTKISSSLGVVWILPKMARVLLLSQWHCTVIKNSCGFAGLGCIVAIRHDVGGTVMIYAHLQSNANIITAII